MLYVSIKAISKNGTIKFGGWGKIYQRAERVLLHGRSTDQSPILNETLKKLQFKTQKDESIESAWDQVQRDLTEEYFYFRVKIH